MFGRPSTFIDTLTRETVCVHLEGGESLKGVLIASYADCLVLAHAVSLWDGGETKIDGDAVLPLAKIKWLQRLGEELSE